MKLFSQVYGKGKPLIIMHGVFGMSDNWATLGKKWSDQYQVHLLDMRNHGRSPHSDEFSYDLMADDLYQYLQQNNIEKARIIGHSMGGKVAMLFSVLNPEMVTRLVVADIAPKVYKPHHQEVVKALKELNLAEISNRSDAMEKFGNNLDTPTKQFLLKSLYRKDQNEFGWRFNVEAISREVQKPGEEFPPNAIFQGPSLFIRGGDSPYIKDRDWETIERHFPHAELETIAGAGHWLHAQKPEEFYDTVSAFLSA